MRENHSELPQCKRDSNLAPGELRTRQNWIGPAGCALHEAPLVSSPFQQVANDMPLPERLIHADSKSPLPVKIGPAQFQSETTRPFLHGAVRVGPLLITLLQCEQGALQNRFSAHPGILSRIGGGIAKNCNRFAMPELGSSGSPYSLKESCRQADRRSIREKSSRPSQKNRRVVTGSLGYAAANGHRLPEYVFVRPIMPVMDAQQLAKTSFATANDLVARMVKFGILREIAGRSRNRSFIYQDYVGLFHDSLALNDEGSPVSNPKKSKFRSALECRTR